MRIANHEEYQAAVHRAAALSDALPDSEQGREYQRLISEIREWDDAHKCQNAHGPERDEGLLTPDDVAVTGLPGNLGKLHKD
ncbi:conserved hypothetical protein [Hyphomicrobiales bacterium]|nr:conserved hypothetical protein [Hyphomicrobiales bacterium]CAI0343377.1 conserved hypothetical protein [Hyphomicrobiales bacterium]